ncbi:unnamed protein product [Prorocentrum cordatum]|uniref:Uncharacterized protein n=1 Tax=Prorocentrum cordatum TaxID=2364126 RepID=A0ABN9P9S8_9DINO|nr:unnamed protein product [Polarella glacialis]
MVFARLAALLALAGGACAFVPGAVSDPAARAAAPAAADGAGRPGPSAEPAPVGACVLAGLGLGYAAAVAGRDGPPGGAEAADRGGADPRGLPHLHLPLAGGAHAGGADRLLPRGHQLHAVHSALSCRSRGGLRSAAACQWRRRDGMRGGASPRTAHKEHFFGTARFLR